MRVPSSFSLLDLPIIAARIFLRLYVDMKIEKGMILSSLSTLSSPLVSFLKNSKMAPDPVAYCYSYYAAPAPPRDVLVFFLVGLSIEP
jgi:hypothetical protein